MYKRQAITNIGQLLTIRPGDGPKRGAGARDLGVIEGAFIASNKGEVAALGSQDLFEQEVSLTPGAKVIDAQGKIVAPGFVDAHTHLVFGGWRYNEYGLRCQGVSYLEIAEKGGGIMSTVEAVSYTHLLMPWPEECQE